MSESQLLAAVRLACSRGDVRLWRNQCGALEDKTGRWVQFGVASPGGSDLIGYRSIVVTPDMVGQRVAIFAAIETKAPRGRVTAEQTQFIAAVTAAGGIAGVVRTVAEAEALVTPPAPSSPVSCRLRNKSSPAPSSHH